MGIPVLDQTTNEEIEGCFEEEGLAIMIQKALLTLKEDGDEDRLNQYLLQYLQHRW